MDKTYSEIVGKALIDTGKLLEDFIQFQREIAVQLATLQENMRHTTRLIDRVEEVLPEISSLQKRVADIEEQHDFLKKKVIVPLFIASIIGLCTVLYTSYYENRPSRTAHEIPYPQNIPASTPSEPPKQKGSGVQSKTPPTMTAKDESKEDTPTVKGVGKEASPGDAGEVLW